MEERADLTHDLGVGTVMDARRILDMFVTCKRSALGLVQVTCETHNKGGLSYGNHNTLVFHLLGESPGPSGESSLGARVDGYKRRRNSTRHGANIEDERLGFSSTRRSSNEGR